VNLTLQYRLRQTYLKMPCEIFLPHLLGPPLTLIPQLYIKDTHPNIMQGSVGICLKPTSILIFKINLLTNEALHS
jgi:hypothetical protein